MFDINAVQIVNLFDMNGRSILDKLALHNVNYNIALNLHIFTKLFFTDNNNLRQFKSIENVNKKYRVRIRQFYATKCCYVTSCTYMYVKFKNHSKKLISNSLNL